MYHYLSGYTSKLAGTEVGIDEPKPFFSAYFGDPFFARMPMVYADSLAKRLKENPQVSVFLVNTGWNGKAKRMSLKDTRAMITAALEGKLDKVSYETHPVFKVAVPKSCPGLSDEKVLDPINSWDDKELYWKKTNILAEKFQENIKKFPGLTEEVLAAGPSPITVKA
jgi:phosphoenolpyruvate carboxykinase (ATP)